MVPPSLLRTKLVPPGTAHALVPRHRLSVDRNRILARRLVLIAAPAGYGKTTLLGELHRCVAEAGVKVGWFSLDRNDNDLTQFLGHFIAAIAPGNNPASTATFGLLGGGVNVSPTVLRNAFLNDVAALAEPTCIFLDDFHLIADSSVLEVVDAVLRSPIAHLHLVIGSRSQQNLPLGWLRVQGQLEILDAKELGFNEQETEAFFKLSNAGNVSQEEILTVQRKTEGWAAGLQLAAIALSHQRSRAEFMRSFSGATTSVSEFLAEEVFRAQAPEIQQFLLATSILDRFNTELCNAVVCVGSAREMINRLANLNLFIFSLDHENNWYRYHHLFSDWLRKKLREEFPADLPSYHLRASAWFEKQDFPVEAIEHALSAGALDRAAQLLEGFSNRLFSEGKTATLLAFSSRLPDRMLDRMPLLLLDCAWNSELCWRFAEAKALLARVRTELDRRLQDNLPQASDTRQVAAKLAHREMMLALLTDDVLSAKRSAEEWLEAEHTRDPFMCASAGTAVMYGNREQYVCANVSTTGKILSDLFFEGGAIYGIPFHESVVGGTHLLAGNLDRAEEAYSRALSMAEELHGSRSALYALPASLMAELRYERNQIDAAWTTLSSLDSAGDLGFMDKLIAYYVTTARILAVKGEFTNAMEVLEEGTSVAERYRFDRLSANILNETTRQLLHLGRTRDAEQLLAGERFQRLMQSKLAPKDGVTTLNEHLALARARVMLSGDAAAEAVALLKQWHSFVLSRRCHRATIRTGILLAKALLRLGNRVSARRMLVDLLQIGASAGFVRPFIDEGIEIVELLQEIHTVGSQEALLGSDYLASIVTAGTGRDAVAAEPSPRSDTAALAGVTSREIQVIMLGARGLQNNDIAKTLSLAESTVKWYWQKVFEKLAVNRRTDAINKARTLRWID